MYSFLTKPKYSLSRYEESLAGSLADLLPMTCSYGCHPLRSRCFFACVATWLAVDVHSGLGAVLASVHDSTKSTPIPAQWLEFMQSNPVPEGAAANERSVPATAQTPAAAADAPVGSSTMDTEVDTDQTDKTKKAKKEKKEKEKRIVHDQPPQVSAIDLRVGFIQRAIKHPDADTLYVSTIDLGEAEPRTICSGLVKYVPLEEMQQRLVVVVANLKPVKMRGIASAGMVLCASTDTTVELTKPPADAKAGDRLCFHGFTGTPEALLNPKKKIWEMFQPGFTTTDALEVVWKDEEGALHPLQLHGDGGTVRAPTLAGASVR